MNGASISGITDPSHVGLDSGIQGVGDVNGDGKADILWRHSTGVVSIWLMNGTSINSIANPSYVGLDWSIQGVGMSTGTARRTSCGGTARAWSVSG